MLTPIKSVAELQVLFVTVVLYGMHVSPEHLANSRSYSCANRHCESKVSFPRILNYIINLESRPRFLERCITPSTHAPVVQRLDNAIHRKNHYPVDMG